MKIYKVLKWGKEAINKALKYKTVKDVSYV